MIDESSVDHNDHLTCIDFDLAMGSMTRAGACSKRMYVN